MFVQWTVNQSANQSSFDKSKVFMSHISYAARCSSQTQLAFFSHLESGNNSSSLITLYQSRTCLTAIYILVFLTSPSFFLSISHPRSRSRTRLASPIFSLPSNCHANRHAAFCALTLSPLIIVFMMVFFFVCVCVPVLFLHTCTDFRYTLCSPKTGFDRV